MTCVEELRGGCAEYDATIELLCKHRVHQQPTVARLEQRHPFGLTRSRKTVDRLRIRRRIKAREGLVAARPVLWRRGEGRARVWGRVVQQLRRQRVLREEARAMLGEQREELGLDGSVERIVEALEDGWFGEAVLFAEHEGALHLRRVVVLHPHPLDQTLLDEAIHRTQRVEQRLI